MKVNLLLNSDAIRGGFLNVDPHAPPNDPDRLRASVASLDHSVEDAEATELIALDIIDYLPTSDVSGTLTHWVKKLRHGGTLTVGGIDTREVARAFTNRQIELEDATLLLYGAQRAPWEYRKGTRSIQHVIQTLQDCGLKIERKQVQDFRYCVTARRP